MPRIEEKALKTELAKHGFESVAVKRELPDGRLELEANKLHPVHVEGGETIYAPIPVSLSVALDTRGGVKSIDGGGDGLTDGPAELFRQPRNPGRTAKDAAGLGQHSLAHARQLKG